MVKGRGWILYRAVSQLTNATRGWTYSYLLEYDTTTGQPTWSGINFISRQAHHA
jgi:hypothetical protein